MTLDARQFGRKHPKLRGLVRETMVKVLKQPDLPRKIADGIGRFVRLFDEAKQVGVFVALARVEDYQTRLCAAETLRQHFDRKRGGPPGGRDSKLPRPFETAVLDRLCSGTVMAGGASVEEKIKAFMGDATDFGIFIALARVRGAKVRLLIADTLHGVGMAKKARKAVV